MRTEADEVTVQLRPGKLGAIALMVVSTLFLAFGAVLFGTVLGETDDGQAAIAMFAAIWTIVNLMLGGYGAYCLIYPQGAAAVVVDVERPRRP